MIELNVWIAIMPSGAVPGWGNGYEFQLPVFDYRSDARKWRKRVAPRSVIRRAKVIFEEPKRRKV